MIIFFGELLDGQQDLRLKLTNFIKVKTVDNQINRNLYSVTPALEERIGEGVALVWVEVEQCLVGDAAVVFENRIAQSGADADA